MNKEQILSAARKQEEWTIEWHESEDRPVPQGFEELAWQNHLRNFNLWHEEDEARRDDRGADHVYKAKRNIDRFNQERNNLIEKMDLYLSENLKQDETAPMHTETPGMIIDRLSIMALKAYHMDEIASDASQPEAVRQRCSRSLQVVSRQRADLLDALGKLVEAISAGKTSFKLYFQFKMYNDPELNPALRRQPGGEAPAS